MPSAPELALTVLRWLEHSDREDAGVQGVVLQPAVMGHEVHAEGDVAVVEVGGRALG